MAVPVGSGTHSSLGSAYNSVNERGPESKGTWRAPNQRAGRALDLTDVITAPYDGINWVVDQIFLFLKELFDRFGPPIVFFGALAESLVGLGVVWPGIGLIVLAAAFSADNGDSTMLIFVLAALGTAIGDTISYGLGRWGSGWLASTRFGPTLRVGRVLMEGRARLLIPFYHLTSWTRAVGPVGAGAMRLPLRIWVPLDYLGAVLSSAVWVSVGAIFGAAVLTEDGTLEQHPALRVGLAAAAIGWAFFLRQAVARASERLEARDRAAAQRAESDEETGA